MKRTLFTIGTILVLIALAAIFSTIFPLLKTEINYQVKKTTFGDLLKKIPTNQIITAPDSYFSIVIPKIEARSKIIANVDAGSPKDYQTALKKGVAHASGTVFPGMTGTIFLFAHSTDEPWHVKYYNAVFYLLRYLENGDLIIIFYQNQRFNYYVTDKQLVDFRQTDFFSQKDQELLVLQTCYPPGTTKQALLIFAQRN